MLPCPPLPGTLEGARHAPLSSSTGHARGGPPCSLVLLYRARSRGPAMLPCPPLPDTLEGARHAPFSSSIHEGERAIVNQMAVESFTQQGTNINYILVYPTAAASQLDNLRVKFYS
jgi:hypothetical protein